MGQCVNNSSPLADCDVTIPSTPMTETTAPSVQNISTTNSEPQTGSLNNFLTVLITAIAVPVVLIYITALLAITFLLLACRRNKKLIIPIRTSQACGVSSQNMRVANATAIVLKENDAYRVTERSDVPSANVATKTNDAYGVVATADVATERNNAYGISTINVATE